MFKDARPSLNQVLFGGIAVLALQGIAMLAFSRTEYLPSPPALSEFPWSIAPWQGVRDTTLDPGALAMLLPDDVLNRQYTNEEGTANLDLFVAYYKTQHKAGGAHDPKVCLPGSGWNPLESRIVQVDVRNSGVSFPVNHYVIEKDSEKAVVLYWYQSPSRIVTGEQVMRFDRIVDTIKSHRTDMALVRIVVPVSGGDSSAATAFATQFAESIYPYLQQQFPAKIVSN